MDENLYSQTYSQLVSKALNGATNFQMIAAPIVFSFPVVPTGQIAPRAYDIASYMPPWAPLGVFTGGSDTVFKAYRDVLSHVAFRVPPEQENEYRKLQDRETAAGNAFTTAESNQSAAYLAQQQNGGLVFKSKYPTIEEWLKGPGAAYQRDIDNKKAEYETATNLLHTLRESAAPALQRALDAIKDPDGDPASTPSPRGWTKVADGSGILRWQPEWRIGTTGQEWRAQLASGSAGSFTVELDASKNTRDFSQSFAGGNVSIDQPFWAVKVGGQWKKLDLSTNDQSVKATISVESSTLVSVKPGDWYDSGFMAGLLSSGHSGSGYGVAPGWNATGPAPALFGKEGILKTMVDGLLVVYKPSFSVTMNASTLEQHKQTIDASAGVRIGPFTFGGEGGHESELRHSTSDNGTFSGASTSDEPLIIGVTVSFPPGQNGPA